MLSLTAQAIEVAVPATSGLPVWAGVVVSLLGAAGFASGFWAWMRLRTGKRLDLEGKRVDQEGTVLGLLMGRIDALQQEIGGLKERLGRLSHEADDLKAEVAKVEAREKRLGAAALAEINRLRAELGAPQLETWPPGEV